MLLKHFFVEKIAHNSFMLMGQKQCAVIDPQRDIEVYIQEARAEGVTITHILQTHLHADFISGHMDLARATGADICIAKSAHCTFNHVPLSEGDTIEMENMLLTVMETPGHTPEHLCFVVTDTARGDSPIGVFVGDTLFVGDVGRPDLFPDIAVDLAGKLFHSLHDKLLALPDYCEVYPAHGAGSLCGRSMGAKFRTTIGYERKYNPSLQIRDKDEFIQSLTGDMPEAPDHFSRCSDINRKGPTEITELPVLEELRVEQFKARMSEKDVVVLDSRTFLSFGSQHIPSSWHLDLNGNFPTFAGWVLPVDKDILLVADDYGKGCESNTWAHRVGTDRIIGYLSGGIQDWISAGLDTHSIRQISARELHELVTGNDAFMLVDVRATAEYEDSHIEGAIHIPVAELRTRYTELDKDKRIILMCSSGNRSSLGTSILASHGFNKLYNLAGGITAYSAAGFTRECTVCVNPHGSRFFE